MVNIWSDGSGLARWEAYDRFIGLKKSRRKQGEMHADQTSLCKSKAYQNSPLGRSRHGGELKSSSNVSTVLVLLSSSPRLNLLAVLAAGSCPGEED